MYCAMPREVVGNIVLVGSFSELAHLQCFTCEFKWFCDRDRNSLCYGTITTIKQQPREAVWDPKHPGSGTMYPQYPVYVQPTAQTYLYVNTATTHVCYRQCSVSKCIGIQHVVVAPGALITGHMANPHPFLPHHSKTRSGSYQWECFSLCCFTTIDRYQSQVDLLSYLKGTLTP